MIRKLFSTLALTAVVAAPAAAQAPYQSTFTFINGASYDTYSGRFGAGTPFQVFCVDPTKGVNPGQTYTNAWVTPFTSGDASHTQNYTNQWNTQYMEAARIASFVVGGDAPGGFTANDYQAAIWTAMGFTPAQVGGIYNATNVAAIRAAAANVVTTGWYVITDVNGSYQEFIFQGPDGTTEVVPEPATMTLLATGLAGMAAARRRRKQA